MDPAADHPARRGPEHDGNGWRVAAWAGGAWAAVYLMVWITGERFSTGYLDYGWQLVPWDVLSQDPGRSVWYLHIQPPGWNATLGFSAYVSPFSDAITLQAVMATFGVVAASFAALVARQLGLGERGAVAVALLATLHPEVLRTAFEPTYELAIAALLLVLVWAVGRSAGARQPGRAAVVVVLVATAVVMTRSLYHPVWLVALALFVAWLTWRKLSTRHVLVAVLVPLLLVGGWMLKNQVLFGEPTLSSWFGMNLQRAVIPVLDADDLLAMHTAGDVSDVAMIGPFEAYERYAPSFEPCTPRHDHRSVAEPWRSTDEFSPNFNFECYLPVFEQSGTDAWAVVRKHPGVWLEGRLWSLRTTFAVAEQPRHSDSVVMQALAVGYQVVRIDVPGSISTQGWGAPIYGSFVARVHFGLLPVAMYVGLALLGPWHLWMLLRRRSADPVRSAVVVAASLTVGWTVLVGAVGELGEQARFRTMTDPLAWVVVVSLVSGWGVSRWRAVNDRRQVSGRT